VGTSADVLWTEAAGTLTFDRTSPPATSATVFDLASLTKPIATATVAMSELSRGTLRLDERLGSIFSEWSGGDREAASVRDLLEHASGLPARLVDQPPRSKREFEHDICTMPLEYGLRTRSLYSDLGFILLGFVLERRADQPLSQLLGDVIARAVPDASLSFSASEAAAPTEPMPDDVRRGRVLRGEVHDNYAAALGGVAGHAGLFGTSTAVGAFAQIVLRAARGDRTVRPPFSPDLVRSFTTKSGVPGSSRALGWDTMLPTSSCGTRMSGAAFGHVGFTGTSLWIDPARDRYFVLLTNRACGGGTLDEMRAVRRAFHDALGDA